MSVGVIIDRRHKTVAATLLKLAVRVKGAVASCHDDGNRRRYCPGLMDRCISSAAKRYRASRCQMNQCQAGLA